MSDGVEGQRRASTPTQVVARRIREARDRRGWSAQRLADECAAAGMESLDRPTITSIETGRRMRVGVDELLVLAFALDVAPTHLLLPLDDSAPVQVVPSTTVPSVQARRWVRGHEQLPGRDEKQFELESPHSEWQQHGGLLPDRGEVLIAKLDETLAVLNTVKSERRASWAAALADSENAAPEPDEHG